MLWIESVPSLRYQQEEDRRDDDREERSGHRIGDARAIVHAVGGHRAEDRDHHHREPVDTGRGIALAQLQPQREPQPEDADRRGERHALLAEEVGHRLAHAGGQQLQDPEDRGDLRDLRQGSACARAVGGRSLMSDRARCRRGASEERQVRRRGARADRREREERPRVPAEHGEAAPRGEHAGVGRVAGRSPRRRSRAGRG